MTPETIQQQLPALEVFLQQKMEKLVKSWQAATTVSQGLFGYLPENAKNLGVISSQANAARTAQGVLADYRLCIANWKLNDPQYAKLGLPRPPFPQIPQILMDEIVEAAAEKDSILDKIRDAAARIGMGKEQTDSLVAALGNVL
jgi:hypothetical protein